MVGNKKQNGKVGKREHDRRKQQRHEEWMKSDTSGEA